MALTILTYPNNRTGSYDKNFSNNDLINLEENETIIFQPKYFNKLQSVGSSVNQLLSDANNLESKNKSIQTKLENTASSVSKTLNDTLDALVSSKESFVDPKQFEHELSPIDGGLYIGLPLKPEFLKINEKHNYESSESLSASKIDLLQGIRSLIKGNIGEAASNFVSAGASAGVKKLLEGLQSPLSQLGGNVYKPKRQTYTGSDTISLKFDWLLSPTTPEESKVIKKIISAFRYLSYPKGILSDNNKYAFLRSNPALWEIQFPNNGAMKNIISEGNRFPIMVCTGVETNFGDGEWFNTFEGNFPVTIKLSISFEEYFSIFDSSTRFGYKSLSELMSDINSQKFEE
jgi:hypothetical protein